MLVFLIALQKLTTDKHPDPRWRERLDEIQEDHHSRTTVNDAGPRNGFRVNHLLGRQLKGKVSLLPTVRTLHAQEVRPVESECADSR